MKQESSRSRKSLTPQDAVPTASVLLDKAFPPTEEERAYLEKLDDDFDVAQKLHDLRIKEGLTQKQLADRVGTKQSVISALENADYQGHSMAMLKKIAAALNRRVVIQFPRRRVKEHA